MILFLDGKYIQPDDQLLDDLTPGRRRLRGDVEHELWRRRERRSRGYRRLDEITSCW